MATAELSAPSFQSLTNLKPQTTCARTPVWRFFCPRIFHFSVRGSTRVKRIYRGHEIDVHKARAMGGWTSIYYSIFRQSDGYECASGFSCEDRTNVHTFMKLMKKRVDAELAEADPWMEKANSFFGGQL